MTKETEALDVTDAEEMRDWLAECIDDSIDMDWQPGWAADLILKRMGDEGITFSRPTGQGGDVGEALASRIAEQINEGNGFWKACSGCQESIDGCASAKDYPYSEAFRCQPGGGCGECGGIGVIWDDTDYDELARFILNSEGSTLRAGQATTADALLRGITDELRSDEDRPHGGPCCCGACLLHDVSANIVARIDAHLNTNQGGEDGV